MHSVSAAAIGQRASTCHIEGRGFSVLDYNGNTMNRGTFWPILLRVGETCCFTDSKGRLEGTSHTMQQ